MWRAARALISCYYPTLGSASSPDKISNNPNNINVLKFYHLIRGNLEFVRQLILALGLVGSPVDHPPEPCLDHCQISDVGRALIRNFEGYSPLRYRDSAGLWTIGVGHLIRPGERFEEPLLGDAAEALFVKDLEPKVAAVNARVSIPLYRGQFDAAVSLVYNIGEGAFAKSTALKKINAARHDEVPGQIKRWNKAGGKVVRGLECLREAEAELYRMRWY